VTINRHKNTKARNGLLSVGCIGIAVVLLTAADAEAQADFSGLQARPGDQVWVTTAGGVEVSGKIADVQPRLLTIEQHRFEPEPGLRIERAGDSLLNGIVIGGAVGAVIGATVAAEACLHTSNVRCVIGGVIGYGALGALIDWLRTGRTVIFEGKPVVDATRVRVQMAANGRRAVLVTVAF
jgi:hypothetical protein